MPSKEAQIDLIRSAYKTAGCDVSQTGYFEAHGTGTAAGDPIETGAIGEVFAAHRSLAADGAAIPLSIGSLKANIGHLGGASGIAGLIKAILSVEKGTIAPNIWFQRGNPAIDFEGWRLQAPTETKDWPLEGLRRASVNSFGYGGTNAHVIVDDAYHYLQQYRRSGGHIRNDSDFVSPACEMTIGADPRSRLFPLSAKIERGLAYMRKTLADHPQTQSDFDEEGLLDGLAYTLCERRSWFSYSATIVAKDKLDPEGRLQSPVPVSSSRATPPRIGFIFTSQGAQWWGMGRELLHYPIFKNSLLRCDTITKSLGADWSLIEELLKDKTTSRVSEAEFSQPLCTALQISLVDLLSAWNVHSHSVIGYSSGEIAAAYATGALSFESAMTVKRFGYDGRMMAVGLSEEESNNELAELDDKFGKAVVACINSPRGITVSGDSKAIVELHKALVAKGVFVRMLQVDTAYTRIRQLGAEYWVSNLVGCVRFSGALEKLCSMPSVDESYGAEVILEVGPHALFKLPVREILENTFGEESHIQYLSTLICNKPADATALQAVGHLCANNYPANLHAVNFPKACRQMCIIAPSTFLPQGSKNVLEYRLREVSISRALVVPESDEGVETSFSMRCQPSSGTALSDVWQEFRVFSYSNDGGWVENCRGLVSVSTQANGDDDLTQACLSEWTEARTGGTQNIEPKSFCESVDAIGLSYAPLFQGLQSITIDPHVPAQVARVIEVTNTRIANPKEFEHDQLLHPTTLDSFLQLALAALGGPELEAKANIFALDPSTSKPVVLMDGFKFVAINGANEPIEVQSLAKHCHKPIWEPDVGLIDRQNLDRELQAAPRPDDRPKTVRQLELLSYYFIDQALCEVNDHEVSTMIPHNQKFYRNLCELRDAVLAKTHPQQTDEWHQLHNPETATKLQTLVEYYRRHQTAYDSKLLVRVGEALHSVFRQEVEPLVLMMQENLLEDYYTTTVGMPNTYAQISRYVTMLSHKYPNLDYLEIGAGMGGATVPMLQGLKGCEDVHTYPQCCKRSRIPSQSNAVRPSESASQVSAAPSTTTLSSTSSLGKRSRKFRSDIWVHFREAVCNEVRNHQSGLYYYCKYCSGRYTNSKSAWTHLQSAYGIAKPDEDGLASKKAATEGALVRGFAATEAKMAAQRERVAKAAMGDCISPLLNGQNWRTCSKPPTQQ
ncbi:hypothetical protein BKA66DRAFT_438522 [Pyrenochaeta sp. MPI-SDFR-AT-0127]|nr:hypothetical protein BKA66DRAFT_438522 [Pyrenochaeta sp. MPI-SDFR-AT-0127]